MTTITELNESLRGNYEEVISRFDKIFSGSKVMNSEILHTLMLFWDDDKNINLMKIKVVYYFLERDYFLKTPDTAFWIASSMEDCIPNSQWRTEKEYTELVIKNFDIWNIYADCLIWMFNWKKPEIYPNITLSLKFWYIEKIDINLQFDFIKNFFSKLSTRDSIIYLIDYFLEFKQPVKSRMLLDAVIDNNLLLDEDRIQYRKILSSITMSSD